ncbi:MAG: helix-turn-helix transcriptional regulator [Acidimicrobiales bacterium]
MIDLAVLGLLSEQELHGYELRKRVAAVLGPGRGGLSFGSLYPALSRMERAGLVKTVEPEREPRTRTAGWSSGSLSGELAAFRSRHPRTGRSQGSRSRKVYGLTEAGRAHLVGLLTDPAPVDERTFALQVAFCRLLPQPDRLELFQRRRAELAARLRELTGGRGGADDTHTLSHRYLRFLREHDIETINCDLAWLDRLIADEATQAQVDREEQPAR